MRFIALANFKKKPKDVVPENVKMIEAESKKGITWLSIDWTPGRYDAGAPPSGHDTVTSASYPHA